MAVQRLLAGLMMAGLGIVVFPPMAATAKAQPALERLEEEVRGLVNEEQQDAAATDEEEPGYLGGFFDDRNENGAGVRVTQVLEGGPAERAGLRPGDLITAIDDDPVRSIDEFAAILRQMRPGGRLDFEVDRDGESTGVEVTLGRRPPREERPVEGFGRVEEPAAAGDPRGRAPARPRMNLLGIRVVDVDQRIAAEQQLPVVRGALVTEVIDGSPAERAGVPMESVIVAINGQRVDTPAELARLISTAGAGAEIKMAYYSRGRLYERKLRLAALDPSLAEPEQESQSDGELPPPQDALAAEQRMRMLEERVRELESRLAELERLLEERD